MLARIAHTTDFSPQSAMAFRHALRLGLAARSKLDLLHVKDSAADASWQSFPHVREVLAQWGLIEPQVTPADIEAKLGVRVSKIEINHLDAVSGISEFFLTHRPDLIVVATHGRHGVNRWLHGSVSEEVARRTHVPTLLIGPDSRGFVEAQSGKMSIRRILLPVTSALSPERALELLSSLLSVVGVTAIPSS
jgi:nucleotide-binding universal stress UspA family protein